MTTTPPELCGNRYRDAVGAVLDCDLPAGHLGVHHARTAPNEYHTWPDALSAPAPGSDISRMTADFAEAGKKMPAPYARLTKALGLLPSVSWDDIVQAVAAERAAHEEHRRQLAAALDAEPIDTCRVVEIDGEPIRVHGAGEMTDRGRAALAEVIAAARRRYAAEHPDEAGQGDESAPSTRRCSCAFDPAAEKNHRPWCAIWPAAQRARCKCAGVGFGGKGDCPVHDGPDRP
ncbi:hypothetical protein [Streptomyces sp. NPDC021224]|uniref:hypothetical protein n=1 Tax=unclassified Streptomyces TaxID=2593676 RepID=UPI0037B7E1DA